MRRDVMGFYRLAREEDFNKEFERFEKIIPKEIIAKVELNMKVTGEAATEFNKLTAMGLMKSRDVLNEYLAVRRAWRDSNLGNDVYTEY
jgi:hypothetical protein